MTAGLLYYTDSRLGEPLASTVRARLSAVGLPIVSVSLAPLAFGTNLVLEGVPSYLTMLRQIVAGLDALDTDAVFFCEHDVLYPVDHFAFRPARPDTNYYNVHVYRWVPGAATAITYGDLRSLSGLCCHRTLALDHFRRRVVVAQHLPPSRDPAWARKWGYEPGKPRRRGGFEDARVETWRSPTPMVDVRHGATFTPAKVRLAEFRHPPQDWREVPVAEVLGWPA
jgi:hypothetical protein